MSVRAKQKRKQRATLAALSNDFMSSWYQVRKRGPLCATIWRKMLTAVMLEEERIILGGTGAE